MTLWTRIAAAFAAITESPNFVAFNAHCWGAAFSMCWAGHLGCHLAPTAAVGVGVAAVKEFWFYLHYETNPPQAWTDSGLDFLGYCVGIAIAAYVYPWRIFP